MAKRLTAGQKRAARHKGVGGKKPGLWPNVWKKRHREVTKRKSVKPHTRTLKSGKKVKVNH